MYGIIIRFHLIPAVKCGPLESSVDRRDVETKPLLGNAAASQLVLLVLMNDDESTCGCTTQHTVVSM